MHYQVTRIGQPIGAVIADNKVHAQRAAKMVKIEYENINPIIVTIEVKFHHFFYVATHLSCALLILTRTQFEYSISFFFVFIRMLLNKNLFLKKTS